MAEITSLLQRANAGEPSARAELYSRVYDELTALARQSLSREATVSQLDAHGLVHEAYLKLQARGDLAFENRRAFFAYAARVMRSVILDTLRSRVTVKRGGEQQAVTLDTSIEDTKGHGADLLAVDSALKALASLDARTHDIFEMHFFGGMSVEDICGVMELSPATVKRDLRKARAWLTSELGVSPDP